ncbi:MAG: hypothetical protein QOE13_2707 [Gaiellaceae bacterium]|nr:hypothetical protein [Gaiellaceae bacterium]
MKEEGKREYRLEQRAERQAATRRRIIEAVVALHEEVGPARTTVVEIAERARVSRPTVYSHFPDDGSLIRACSRHWSLANPRPDPTAWKSIADPQTRLRDGLEQLYAYYSPRERMLSNVFRDAALIPSLFEAIQHTVVPYSESAAKILATGWKTRSRDRRKLLAVLRLALDFHTWQTLTRHGGLTNEEAAGLMAGLVAKGVV